MSDVTRIWDALAGGDARAADDLLPLVYAELRRLAAQNLAREKPGQTLDATALVHEAYLRLVGGAADRFWDGRGHFFAAAAEAMRRILVDAARRRRAAKRGGQRRREDLDPDRLAAPAVADDILALDEALARLAAQAPAKAELVKLRYFAGCTLDEAADLLGLSPREADRAWAYAKAWLKVALRPGASA